jgi:hypothetical protein
LGQRFGDHDGERIADMAHALGRQNRMGRLLHRAAVFVLDEPAARKAADRIGRHVGAGEHRHHAVGRFCFARFDAYDHGVGRLGAHEKRVDLVRARNVVRIVPLARQKPVILFAAHRRANSVDSHLRFSLQRFAFAFSSNSWRDRSVRLPYLAATIACAPA